MGIFFTYDQYKARIHMVQSNTGMVVKEYSPVEKSNFKDSNSLLGNHEEKACMWRTATFTNSPSFSARVTPTCCSPASPSKPAPHCVFPRLTSSLLTPVHVHSYNPSPSD